jgi:hypothetical protein
LLRARVAWIPNGKAVVVTAGAAAAAEATGEG